jgi:DNA-directed RNA polymerase subunit alpha
VIAIDSIFSPVSRVKYEVGATRVGQMTDFDKVILDIWTDGRIEPHDALLQASAILRHPLDVFVNYDDNAVGFEEAPAEQSDPAMVRATGISINQVRAGWIKGKE